MPCGRWLNDSSARFSERIEVRVSSIRGEAWYSTVEAAEPTLSMVSLKLSIGPPLAFNFVVICVAWSENRLMELSALSALFASAGNLSSVGCSCCGIFSILLAAALTSLNAPSMVFWFCSDSIRLTFDASSSVCFRISSPRNCNVSSRLARKVMRATLFFDEGSSTGCEPSSSSCM